LDLLIGLVFEKDSLHDISEKIFNRVKLNKINDIYIPTSVYLEYELILKSKGVDEQDIMQDIIHFKNIPNIGELPLNSSILINASILRKLYDLTYFDSLHCASALNFDNTCISTDKDFEKIPNLILIKPQNLIGD